MRKPNYEKDDAAFPAYAYTVDRYAGIAWWIFGWETQPDEDTEWTLLGNVDATFKKRKEDGLADAVNWCKPCQLMFSGKQCPGCGRAPTRAPRSIFAPPPVDRTNEELYAADKHGPRDAYDRETKIKHWFLCLRTAGYRNGTFKMASAIYHQKYSEYPERNFPCVPTWENMGAKVKEMYPHWFKTKEKKNGYA